MSADVRSETVLEEEARVAGRYLVGRVPPPELVARYAAAVRTLFPAPGAPAEEAALAFARRHPWTLGPLDAAAAFLRPAGLLRSRVLVMAAVLEASPAFADAFLPRNASFPRFLGRLAVSGAIVAGQVLVGAALWPLAARARA